jgi:hypothetical protein
MRRGRRQASAHATRSAPAFNKARLGQGDDGQQSRGVEGRIRTRERLWGGPMVPWRSVSPWWASLTWREAASLVPEGTDRRGEARRSVGTGGLGGKGRKGPQNQQKTDRKQVGAGLKEQQTKHTAKDGSLTFDGPGNGMKRRLACRIQSLNYLGRTWRGCRVPPHTSTTQLDTWMADFGRSGPEPLYEVFRTGGSSNVTYKVPPARQKDKSPSTTGHNRRCQRRKTSRGRLRCLQNPPKVGGGANDQCRAAFGQLCSRYTSHAARKIPYSAQRIM